MDDDTPLFSRPAGSHPEGKLQSLPNVMVGWKTLERLKELAAEEHMPFSEYVRTLLEAHVHGPDEVLKVSQDRLRRVLRIGVTTSPLEG